MRALLAAVVAVGVLCGVAVTGALAANPPGSGQPSQTCLSSTAPNEPGNAANSPGSPFNEVDGHAGSVYAGSQPQNSKNSHSASQYDVACFQVSHH
jgi:hypothetical protein